MSFFSHQHMTLDSQVSVLSFYHLTLHSQVSVLSFYHLTLHSQVSVLSFQHLTLYSQVSDIIRNHRIRNDRRASCVGTFEVFEAAHVALRTLLAFSQPVNCIFWPIGMLNWLVAASKLHKHRETCCTGEWPFYSFLIL